MTSLYQKIIGKGTCDLVLLHGWGLNTEVWNCIIERLKPHFRLHLIDLPGYGKSQGFGAMSLEKIGETLLASTPKNAWWLGWSLGGLVASQVALMQPNRMRGLISVSSSPCFISRGDWPGISQNVLSALKYQLSQDFQRTINRFLDLQAFGVHREYQNTRLLRSVFLNQSLPTLEVLNAGLEILCITDLRCQMAELRIPVLRIYGSLDALVPRKVAEKLDISWPYSTSIIIPKAAHAPFISHPDEFASIIVSFSIEN